MGFVEILGERWRIRKLDGRVILNGVEQDVVVHHDEHRIDVSDDLDKGQACLAVAQAVAVAVARRCGASVPLIEPNWKADEEV